MKKSMSWGFIIIIAMLYVAFVLCDIFSLGYSNILKYASVCVMAVASLFAGKEKSDNLVKWIFGFVLIADGFFLIIDKPLFGIGTYFIIQMFHTVRLTSFGKRHTKAELLKRIIPAAILTTIGSFVNIVFALIPSYAVCIGENIAHSCENMVKHPSKRNLIYMFSMFCLAVCDACVGLRCFPFSFMTPELSHIALTVTWVAYVPSLVLLLATTNALNFKDKPNKELIHN